MKILSFGSLNYDYTYEVEHFLAPKETLAARSMQRGAQERTRADRAA